MYNEIVITLVDTLKGQINHKTIKFKLSLLALLVTPLAYALEVETSVDVDYLSRFVDRGLQVSGRTVQAQLNANAGSWTACIWTNQPPKEEPEYDFTFGYTWEYTNGASLLPSVKIYNYPNASQKHTTELCLENKKAISGTLSVLTNGYYDVDLKGYAFEAGLCKELTLSQQVSLKPQVMVGTTNYRDFEHGASAAVHEHYSYLMSQLAIVYQPSAKWTLRSYVGCATQRNFDADRNQIWTGIGVSYKL